MGELLMASYSGECKEPGCGTPLRADNVSGWCMTHGNEQGACKECGKRLRFDNTTGFCQHHLYKRRALAPDRPECKICGVPLVLKGRPSPTGICNRTKPCKAAHAAEMRRRKVADEGGRYLCLGCGDSLGMIHHERITATYICRKHRALSMAVADLLRSLEACSIEHKDIENHCVNA